MKPKTVMTDVYYYSNPGYGGFDKKSGKLWAGVYAKKDTGQWTYVEDVAGYGVYKWKGRHLGDLTGWTLQGLSCGKACKYVAFERLGYNNVFKCITYDRRYSTQHKRLLQSSVEETTYLDYKFYKDFVKQWHDYTIVWVPNAVCFFIDDKLVAVHKKIVPVEKHKLHFHIHAAVAPSQTVPVTDDEVYTEAKNLKFLELSKNGV